MMKILITHVYARKNNGDAAILYAQVKELQRILPSAEITISSMEDAFLHKDFYGVPQVPALISSAYIKERGRLSNLYHLIRSLAGSYFWAVSLRWFGTPFNFFMFDSENIFLNELQRADIVVPVGGGYIQARGKGLFNLIDLILILQPLYLATFIKKPVILYSQSIGPFKSNLQKKIAGNVLRKCTQINVRENTSLKVLESMDVPTEIVQLTTDAAFLLVDYEFNNKINPEILEMFSHMRKPIIGVTARAWLKKENQSIYEYEFASALDIIIERYNASVIFIPQVTVSERGDDDRVVQSKIFQLMNQKKYAINLDDELDFMIIKKLYGDLDYLIGTRFHSVIFALSGRIPSIAIEYEHKTSGIMNDLGLREWVVEMKDVTAKGLIDLFDKLVIHREEYLRQLHEVFPAYIKQARKANDLIMKIGKQFENIA